MSDDGPIIEARGLSKSFGQGDIEVDVFQGIDLEVKRGERVAIIGSSGAGKSTLLHILGGLDRPGRGQVKIDGQEIGSLGQRAISRLRNQVLGFVYQFHHLLPEFTARENVAMPLLIRGVSRGKALQAADQLLARVGLADRGVHKPGELSGGERQRAAVARALVARPACLLADEPTGNLDHANALEAFELMLSLNIEIGSSLIIVTHEQELADRMDRVLILENGRLHQAS